MRKLLYPALIASGLVAGALAFLTSERETPPMTEKYVICQEGESYKRCFSKGGAKELEKAGIPPAVANPIAHHAWITAIRKNGCDLEELTNIDKALLEIHEQVPERKAPIYNLSRRICQGEMPLDAALSYVADLHQWDRRESELGPFVLYEAAISGKQANAYWLDLHKRGIGVGHDDGISMDNFNLLIKGGIPTDIVNWYWQLSNSLTAVNIDAHDIIALEKEVADGHIARDDISAIAIRQEEEIRRERLVKLLR